MKTIILAVSILFIFSSAQSQTSLKLLDKTAGKTDTLKKLNLKESPKIDVGDLAGEFALGNLLGGLGGFCIGAIGTGIEKSGGSHGEMAGFGGFVIGFIVGHSAGSILGVTQGISTSHVSGNIGLTILGGLAGSTASVLYVANGNANSLGGYIFAGTFPTAGAMIGFNSSLYYTDKKNVSEIKESGTHFKIKNDFEVNVIKLNFQLPNELELSKIPERFLLALK
ncbi:MAG: hypothetical protein JST55_02725 [Bacteroidetes bacterium]|nr:hypothetical protein [Bacteroidota bacterium]